MNVLLWTYVGYAVFCILVTVWVGGTLRRYGSTVIGHGTNLPEPLVQSLAHLLCVGFYLINFGMAAFYLTISTQVKSPEKAIEIASTKVGVVMLVLAMSHFFMLAMFAVIRRNEATKISRAASLANA